ncbi:MAG: long-chain fatty acid--CoA ligase [Balneolaceae bacterium]|nr:MAG: long-chain fatty acid--CoA ligase [Balneolaceae bacterium]
MDSRIIASNLADLYKKAADKYETLPAFATRIKALEWEHVTFRDLYERGRRLSAGLIELGVEAREHVGLFSDNRYEWMLADYGIQLSGAVNTPRGADVTDDELIYIVNHARIRVAFVENDALQKKIIRLWPELPELQEIILMSPKSKPLEGVRALEEVLAIGALQLEKGDTRVDERMEGIRPDDLFTLIYTSGTTGKPKGVMLTHSNMMSQMSVIPIELQCTDRVLSILPIWHIFERVFEVYTVSCGACNYYTSIRTLGEDLQNVEPTFMGSAPRLWESLHQRILENVRAAHPVRRALFHIAYFLGHYYQESIFYISDNDLQLKDESKIKRTIFKVGHLIRLLIMVPWYGFFNVAVLEAIRKSAGGSIKATVSGGGALPIEIDKFFNYIGIPVLEGYGMTETCPVIAVRTEDRLVNGTVGPPVQDTEVRIVDLETEEVLFPNKKHPHEGRGMRGEIWVRGPQVMKGYYREPEITKTVLREGGWLRTGDLGMMTFNDSLKILGRSKSTIVLSNGENLEPEPIEMQLRQSRYIEQCMVVGQDQKYVGALIVPKLDAFVDEGVEVDSMKELVDNARASKIIRDEIRVMMARTGGFKRFEQVREFRLLPKTFKVGDEVTNLFKLKRHVIEKKYEQTIKEMFAAKEVKV